MRDRETITLRQSLQIRGLAPRMPKFELQM